VYAYPIVFIIKFYWRTRPFAQFRGQLSRRFSVQRRLRRLVQQPFFASALLSTPLFFPMNSNISEAFEFLFSREHPQGNSRTRMLYESISRDKIGFYVEIEPLFRHSHRSDGQLWRKPRKHHPYLFLSPFYP
jgi:hypothetical protein